MTRLRIGTRGSKLALAQAHTVESALRARDPSIEVEIVQVQTSGDRIQDVPLGPSLGQAFFTKELEDALLDGRIDVAVHSCKDLGTVLPAGLLIAAVPEREDPRDALVGPRSGPRALPNGARVGTSSPRRRRFLAAMRPDLQLADVRGNVPTRVAAVDEGRFDAVVLAVAGLRRVGLEGRINDVLEASAMLPAAGQGALAIEARQDDPRTTGVVAALECVSARAEITAERACLRRLGAGCQAPVGALGRVRGGELRLRAAVAVSHAIESVDLVSTPEGAEALGTFAAEGLLQALGMTTLRGVAWTESEASRTAEP